MSCNHCLASQGGIVLFTTSPGKDQKFWTGEMVPLVNSLLQNHKDLSLCPQYPFYKTGHGVILALRSQTRGSLGLPSQAALPRQ